MKRRYLVLSDEATRHWFRASLPRTVCRVEMPPVAFPARSRRIAAQDVRDFLLAYCACFIALTVWFL